MKPMSKWSDRLLEIVQAGLIAGVIFWIIVLIAWCMDGIVAASVTKDARLVVLEARVKEVEDELWFTKSEMYGIGDRVGDLEGGAFRGKGIPPFMPREALPPAPGTWEHPAVPLPKMEDRP